MTDRTITYRQAINEALGEEMERDGTVFLIGQDIAGAPQTDDPQRADAWGGAFGVTKGLLGRFGRKRVIDTPISESAIIGAAIGAAATGLRPVPELMYVDFIGVCLDQVGNQAAKMRYMTGGQVKAPLTIRTMMGAGLAVAGQHSNVLYSIFAHYPGLKCVAPSTPADAKGLLKASVRDDDPVVFFEHKNLYNDKGPVPEGEHLVALGKGRVVREGGDATVVAISQMVKVAVAAADMLSQAGIEIEIIDPRTLVPLDEDLILESVRKTGRFIVVDEDHPVCSMAGDLVARVCERAFDALKSPPRTITPPHVTVPFSPPLEKAYLPSADRVASVIGDLVRAPAREA